MFQIANRSGLDHAAITLLGGGIPWSTLTKSLSGFTAVPKNFAALLRARTIPIAAPP